MKSKVDPLERLRLRSVVETSGCIIVPIKISKRGRPMVCVNGKNMLATRAIIQRQIKRKLGRWELVCHTCDNSRCVNPDHLYVGTAATNIRDAVNRKRLWVQQPSNKTRLKKLMSDTAKKNRRNKMTSYQKINPDSFPEIMKAVGKGESHESIAKRYGVSQTTISRWVRGAGFRRAKALAEWEARDV